MNLIGLALLGALALGLLVAFALRNCSGPRLRYTVAAAAATTIVIGIALIASSPARQDRQSAVLRLRPRHPARAGGRRGRAGVDPPLDQELDAQLVGLARLVTTRPS